MRAQQGDQSAFESITVASHPRLYRIAYGILRETGAADDATQQALIDIWRRLPRLRDPARYEGWSYRLLVHACYAEARRRPGWLPESMIDPSAEPRSGDPYAIVLDRDQLERGFRQLTVEHRAVIVLRYLMDLPMDQIAQALDIPIGTVGSRSNRAVRALRASVEADDRPGPARVTAEGTP